MNRDDVLTIDQVAELLGVSSRTVRNWMDAAGMSFPRPISIGPRLKRWRRSEVQAWLETRMAGTAAE